MAADLASPLIPGRNEIYVRDFPEARRKWIVSTAGGVQPEWSGDDRTLYYISTQRDLMQVSIEPDPAGVRIGAPMVLFRTNIAEADTGVRNRYVADPSGKRFLITAGESNQVPGAHPITVVLNWPARAAAGK